MSIKKITTIGLILWLTYFIIVAGLIITGCSKWLIAFEIITILGGIYLVPFIIMIPFSDAKKQHKTLGIIAASSAMILTVVVHTISLTVITPLINSGVTVPEYWQIGKWPSALMTLEYLGWGLFMGLTFICSSLAIEQSQSNKLLKVSLIVCGALCLIGFLGTIITNPHLRHIAPIGYGIGSIVIFIQSLLSIRKQPIIHTNHETSTNRSPHLTQQKSLIV